MPEIIRADLLDWNYQGLVLGEQQKNCIHNASFGGSGGVDLECWVIVVKVLVLFLFWILFFHNSGSKTLNL